MSDLDLVLVNPGNRTQIYQSLGSKLSAIEPPVWAGLIATFVRRKGFSVKILDANAEDLSIAETVSRIRDMNPTLVALVVYGHNPSASTQVMPSAGAISTGLKQECPEQRIVFVGGHAAALPERTLLEEDTDFVAADEGLQAICGLLNALKSGRERFDDVPGLCYLQGSELRKNPPSPLVRDLDTEMPGIAWDLLPMHLYRAHNWHCFDGLQRQPYAAIYTTLGCPYHCSFCCIQAPFKGGEKALGYKESTNSYRFWSPEAVLREIDLLVNQYGVRNIKFADEMFVLNRRHVTAICEMIIERGYDLNIWAYSRIDTIKDGMLPLLKQAGVNWLAFGIEAGSDRVRDEVQKGVGHDEIFEVIAQVRAAGINVIGNYIFGLPEDDHETMQETLDMAIDLNCEFANFYSTMAYPGSQLYERAQKEGWPLPAQWSGYSQHAVDTLPLRTNYLDGAEVLRFRDDAFHKYHANPGYLQMIEQKFGPETVEHIRVMAGHKLIRERT